MQPGAGSPGSQRTRPVGRAVKHVREQRGRPLIVALLLLIGVATAATLVAGSGARGARWDFGPQAGYAWRGPVRSVGASWRVPHILGSRDGWAATWVGAQSRSSAFIQLGIAQVRSRSRDGYAAFWSDRTRRFLPQWIFRRIHPGDEVTATISLHGGEWTLVFSDATSGQQTRFSTREEAGSSFGQAEWTQEDPGPSGKPVPYLELSSVALRRVSVNSASPSHARLLSVWMTAAGRYFAPSPFSGSSFSIRPASLSAPGDRYLSIIVPLDKVVRRLDTLLSRWSGPSFRRQIGPALRDLASELRRSDAALAANRWPEPAVAGVNALVTHNRTLFAMATDGVPASGAQLGAWVSAWRRVAIAGSAAAQASREALHVPSLGPRF